MKVWGNCARKRIASDEMLDKRDSLIMFLVKIRVAGFSELIILEIMLLASNGYV